MFEKLKGKLPVKVKQVNRKIALLLAAAFTAATCCGFAYAAPNVVTITDTESAPVQVKTTDTNVGKMKTNLGGKLVFSVELSTERDVFIKVVKC